MRHFMTYEFIYEFLYMKKYCEIIPEILCTKVPDVENIPSFCLGSKIITSKSLNSARNGF